MLLHAKVYWLILLSLLIIACQTFYQLVPNPQTTQDQAGFEGLTQAAEYIYAALTLTALEQQPTFTVETPLPAVATITPTAEVSQPTEDNLSIENQSAETSIFVAKLPTATDTPPAMATAAACRYAANLDYETIPAGKEIPLNFKFTKMWRLRNSGNCEWDNNFVLVCTKNCDLFGGATTIPISYRTIKPKEQVEVRVELRAPKDRKLVGKKLTATWMIRGGGKVFGVQPDGKTPLSVTIKLSD
jgi:hypothetical protein